MGVLGIQVAMRKPMAIFRNDSAVLADAAADEAELRRLNLAIEAARRSLGDGR